MSPPVQLVLTPGELDFRPRSLRLPNHAGECFSDQRIRGRTASVLQASQTPFNRSLKALEGSEICVVVWLEERGAQESEFTRD